MKLHLLAGVSTITLALGWSSAYAADAVAPRAEDLWYVTLFGGASFANDVKTQRSDTDIDYSIDLNTGFVIGGAVGRRINDVFRVEGELSYAHYKASSGEYNFLYGDSSLPVSGNLSATYILANVWADVVHFGDAKVYVGGGIGAAFVTADTSFFAVDTVGYGRGSWGFAGQLGAGVTYAVTQTIDLDFGYRFKAVSSVDFDRNTNKPTDARFTYDNGKLYSHNLQLGVSYKF